MPTVLRAYASGIRLFDTAPHYGAGIAERRLGAALRHLPRSEITISTKVGRLVDGGSTVPDFSRDGILRSLEASKRHLGVDHLEVIHIHDPDDHMEVAISQSFPMLSELKQQGEIGAIGVGTNRWEMLLEFVHQADLDCALLAGRYTLLESRGPRDVLFPVCADRGVETISARVFNSGILATGNIPDARFNYRVAPAEVRDQVDRLQAICNGYGINMAAAAVQFPRRHPVVSSMVVGARSPAEVDALQRNLAVEIPDGCWNALAELPSAVELLAHEREGSTTGEQ